MTFEEIHQIISNAICVCCVSSKELKKYIKPGTIDIGH
jgi:hypothetical protein